MAISQLMETKFIPHEIPRGFDSSNGVIVDCFAFVGSSVYKARSSSKTSPRYLRRYEDGNIKATAHAEMAVLTKIPSGVNPSRIRILTIRRVGNRLSNSKPCYFCQVMLKSAGIKPNHVEYYDWDGKRRRLKDWTLDHLKEDFPC